MASLELTKLCHLGAMAGLPGELGEDDRGTYTAVGIEKPWRARRAISASSTPAITSMVGTFSERPASAVICCATRARHSALTSGAMKRRSIGSASTVAA